VASNLHEKIRRASTNVGHVCEMLMRPSPEVLDQCSVLLETAARDLAGRRPQPDGKDPILPDARQLLRAVRHARILLDSAFAFHQVWSCRLGVMTAGYTARGEPASADHGSRLAVRG
jgi:hypothetical protein